jgi:murein endopeptidase
MSQMLWKLLCATLLAASGCQSAEAEPAEPAAPAQEAVLVDQAAPVDLPPAADMGAVAAAGELPAEPWPMEPLASWDPGFPYLEGEDQTVSRSVGDVQEGWLVEGVALQMPHERLRILPVQAARGLNYTTREMVTLLEGAAQDVAKAYPGAVVSLGNLSAPGGGDIPYSVSHNSGRDGDVAFFVTDEAGAPAQLPDLLPLDRHGRYEGEHGVFLFDVARSWALVEGLLRHGGAQLQVIFVSTPLKRLLLAYAKEHGADAAMIGRAERMLVQPKGSLPHDDHFHVRIFCGEVDRRSGCVDGARGAPGHEGARAAALKDALRALGSEEEQARVAGARRVALIGGKGQAGAVSKLLKDASPRVRAAAARALAELGTGAGPIASALRKEESGEVVAEYIEALGRVGGRASVGALVRVVDRRKAQPLVLGALDAPTDARALAADALAGLAAEQAVEALMARLEDGDGEVRQRASRALALITNHEFLAEWRESSPRSRKKAVEAWAAWWKEHGKAGRARWLAMGFVTSGYAVEALDRAHVWELCKAITGPYHISQNAQRALMALVDHDVPSVQWSVEDASFYWRRWLERKRKLFRLPARPKGWAPSLSGWPKQSEDGR